MVYAIKAAGLAIGMGIGSSFIVLVSFTWGIFIFHEKVESRIGASFAVFLMMAGLWGMSYYSSPRAQQHLVEDEPCGDSIESSRPDGYSGVHSHSSDKEHDDESFEEADVFDDNSGISLAPLPDVVLCGRKISQRKLGMAAAVFNGAWGGSIMVPMEFAP